MLNRRAFIQTSVAAGAVLTAGPAGGGHAAPSRRQSRTFKLAYAPNLGTFRNHAGDDPVANLEYMAAQGFTAFEHNGLRSETTETQELIGRTLERLGMRMGVFVAHAIDWREPSLTTGRPEHRDAFLRQVRESVDVARRVGATWITVVPGHVDRRPDMDFQTASVVETLRRAAAILEPHGLVMVLEPLNTLRDHPGMFLTHTPQAYLICRAVDSPSCKILYDIYHQQITEGNLIPNIDAAWDEIAYFQVGDNPGRMEPGTGEINYRNVFRHIHAKGYAGIVGMEHGSSLPGVEGERAVLEAYLEADAF